MHQTVSEQEIKRPVNRWRPGGGPFNAQGLQYLIGAKRAVALPDHSEDAAPERRQAGPAAAAQRLRPG